MVQLITKLSHHETVRQAFLYLLVGGVTFVVDVLSTSLLYYFAGLPAYLASAIGFLAGFFFSFPMNRKRVFRHDSTSRFNLRVQASLFLALSIVNLFISAYGVELIVNYNLMQIQYAKTFLTIVIACWNFLIFKHFIFRKIVAANTLD